MAKQKITIIDAGPTQSSIQELLRASELKRRGVRFLPRQAYKHLYRAVQMGCSVNPFTTG